MMDELPGVTLAGANPLVAPAGRPFAERLTAFENVPFCAATVMVKVAVCAGRMVCAAGDAVTVKPRPTPVSATVCGDPVALSATERVALELAELVGEKVTEMLQNAPAASEVPQLLVCAKAAEPAPLSEMEVIVSGDPPVLES